MFGIADKKFLYLHVPKTGGMSLRAALRPFDMFMATKDKLRGMPSHPFFHVAQEWIDTSDYWCVSTVRNPWERTVSMWRFASKCSKARKGIPLDKRPWARHRERMREDTTDGLKYWLFGHCEKYNWNVWGDKECTTPAPFITQSYWCDGVDSIFRLEDGDLWQEVSRYLDVPLAVRHENKSAHRDYREYYDAELHDWVTKTHKEDIERFGYTFDGVE